MDDAPSISKQECHDERMREANLGSVDGAVSETFQDGQEVVVITGSDESLEWLKGRHAG